MFTLIHVAAAFAVILNIFVGIVLAKGELSSEEKVCKGTENGLALLMNEQVHWQLMIRNYAGCNIIQGNLEITHLTSDTINYDLSFLKSIRVVTGYVLIGLVRRELAIPLDNLELIRGKDTFSFNNGFYSLFVGVTKIKELRMTSLLEIATGSIMFVDNSNLCYINTIRWDVIAPRAEKRILPKSDTTSCFKCSTTCTGMDHRTHCWAPDHCQRGVYNRKAFYSCPPSCPGRCTRKGCCHSACAAGCWGPDDTQCKMCKDFRFGEKRCVRQCPAGTKTSGRRCYTQQIPL